MVKCFVLSCKNYSEKKNLKKLKYFHFPKDQAVLNKWIAACGRKDYFNPKGARICAEHFTSDDWRLQDIYLNIPENERKLKEGAIPTKNLHFEERIENINNDKTQILMDIETINDKSTQTGLNFESESESMLVKQLEKENMVLKKNYEITANRLQNAKKILNCILTKSQVRKIMNPNMRIRWTSEDISSAVSLYSAGPQAYTLLRRRNFPLPAASTLRRWSGKIKLKPGILDCVLNLIANSVYENNDKLCVLCYGKIKMKSNENNKLNDMFIESKSDVLVVMIRGLIKNWKQIIYYDFNSDMQKEILNEIIRKIEEINFTVVAVVANMTSLNLAIWKELEISEEKPYIINPANTCKKIYFFANATHLIKSIRNHFLDNGFYINNKLINSKPIEELLNLNSSYFNISHRVTKEHLIVNKTARQNVKIATQIFSNSISESIKKCTNYIECNNSLETSDFIKITNDWFDIFNSKRLNIDFGNMRQAYGWNLKEQDSILLQMSNNMRNLRVNKLDDTFSSSLFPFQEGILLNNSSLKQLYVYLNLNYNITQITTNSLNRNELEKMFDAIRFKGGLIGNPTVLEFTYRLRSYILCNISKL